MFGGCGNASFNIGFGGADFRLNSEENPFEGLDLLIFP